MLTAFVACDNVSTDGSEGKSKLNLYLTDAPAEYEEVNVDVQKIRIRYLPSGDTTDTTASEGKSRWVELPIEPFRINLLELTDTDTLIAMTEDLKPGRYSELRLILGEDNDIVIGGEAYKLTTPSAQQSGYKIKFDARLESDEELDLSIDFDAERSVVKAGNSGKYILKPVLKAFKGRVDPEEEG